ncbi:DUF6273 domain-containing protein [Eubacterium xylanophilum]|uniref:DUF6273 domain-containing protein n=1 Tax=Eubacterium xylanophilum TaxID=39497 RepID=UPI00047AF612|nr:DUF6273 domain-containing protein [Eubacterium xylanophilum]
MRKIKFILYFLSTIVVSSLFGMHEECNAAVEWGGKSISKISFGSFWQKDNMTKEPIVWDICSLDGNVACLTTKNCLHYMTFSDTWAKKTTWKNSTCRKWLNEYFYKNAFSTKERESMIPIKKNLFDYTETNDNVCLPVFATNISQTSEFAQNVVEKYNLKERFTYWALMMKGKGDTILEHKITTALSYPGEPIGYVKEEKGSDVIIKNRYFAIRPTIYVDLSKGGWNIVEYFDREKGNWITYPDSRDATKTEASSSEGGRIIRPENLHVIKPQYKSFNIKKISIKNSKKRANKVRLKWKKTGDATSYNLWYSTSKKFSKSKTKKLKITKTSCVIKLKKSKKYYVKARGVLKVDKITAHGKWSKIKTI